MTFIMKQHYFAISLILFAIVLPMRAQEPTLKSHKNERLGKGYIEDVSVYVETVKATYESDELFKKLGDMYYFDHNHEEASIWYEKLYAVNNGMVEPEYLLKYSRSLKTMGNEILATKINNEFMNVSGNITVEFPSSFDNSVSIEENTDEFNARFSSIPTRGNDGLVENEFQDVSDYNYYGRRRRNGSKRRNGDDGPGNNRSGNNTNINLHESTVAITKDGSTMYFTRPYTISNSIEPDRAQLRVYRAHKVNDKWGNIEDLSINGANYSNAQPVLSLDEKTLYFSSDMPSSYGKTDIYAVAINDNGSLDTPRNLGPKVNTRKNESFPFISSSDGLYFSSDGHYGNGGFDVYYVDLKNDDKKLWNLGKSINGPQDDFTLPSFGRFGIKSDSYDLRNTKYIQGFFHMKITVTVLDNETNKPINGARVIVVDDNGVEKMVLETDQKGYCIIGINRFKAYILKIERDEYESTYEYIAKGNSNRGLHLTLKRNRFQMVNKTDKKEGVSN